MNNKVIVTFVSNTGGNHSKSEGKESFYHEIEKKWPKVIKKYKKYHSTGFLSNIGDIQPLKIDQRASMKIFSVLAVCIDPNGNISLDHLKRCFNQFFAFSNLKGASLHLCYDSYLFPSLSLLEFRNLLASFYSEDSGIHSFIYFDQSDQLSSPPAKKRKIQSENDQVLTVPVPSTSSPSTSNRTMLNSTIFKSVNCVLDGFNPTEKEKLASIITKCGGT